MYGNMEGQISHQVTYSNTPNLLDQHPPYIPPFQVEGLAPGSACEEDIRLELQWNSGLESKKKRPIEQTSLENNFGINKSYSSQVSTGLGLSLENPRLSSMGDSELLGVVGDAVDLELQRQHAEIDRYMKLQGDCLRRAILEKFQATQLQTILYVEEKVMQKFQEKEDELENINKKNIELESQIEQLTIKANAWQQRAKYGENMINTLKHNLQQVYAQSRDSKEGCGDSEVDDTASCSNGHPLDFQVLFKDKNDKRMMTCKVCKVNEVCMLLLPCKHLCLCKECENRSSLCPVCQSSKYVGMEIYM